jgi:hypothetical protein
VSQLAAELSGRITQGGARRLACPGLLSAALTGLSACCFADSQEVHVLVPMKDLTPRWIIVKAVLFLFLGALAAILIFVANPDWRTAVLLAVAIWSFCRLYYFAFYVIEKYVDPAYKFSGLLSFLEYWLRRR